MAAYFNRLELTEQTLAGGWLHTRDLGRVDDDGFLHLVDRKKDMIATRGQRADNVVRSMFALGCRASVRDGTVIAQWREGRWATDSLQLANL